MPAKALENSNSRLLFSSAFAGIINPQCPHQNQFLYEGKLIRQLYYH
jgi:hypothetical protein